LAGDISQPKARDQHQFSADHLKPAEGWQTGPGEGWRAVFPKLINLLVSILAKNGGKPL